jgi:hypothetical protein
MWLVIKKCEFYRSDGTTFSVEEGTKLKELSRLERPNHSIWRDISSMNKNKRNKGKKFIALWCEGKARIFEVNLKVTRVSRGTGNIWRI